MTTSIKIEPLWHVELAVLVAMALQIALPQHLTLGPKYAIAFLELLLLIGLRFSQDSSAQHHRRKASLILTGLVSFANISSLILVLHHLINGNNLASGQELIISAVAIYLTNIIIFGLWYWQLDGGGAGGRGTHQPPVDFLFPQMSTEVTVTQAPEWRPMFFDYLFISITNATAFSPTDSLPLTHRAKLLMSVQGLASLLTIALVAARAINILA